jgi:uncharacterized membrane protein
MTEEQKPQEPEVVPPTAGAPLSKDVEEGRTFAILSYALSFISIPFFLVPLIMRNNDFSLYHAKQCLMIWLAGIAVGVVGSLLMVVCIGVILLPAGMIFLLVLAVMGLMNAVQGLQKPVPVIGKYAEDWFKGITKV